MSQCEAERFHGNYSKKGQGRKKAQVFVAPAQPLPDMRAAARVSPQVRPLPPVFPRVGVARGDPRGFEVVLVRGTFPPLILAGK